MRTGPRPRRLNVTRKTKRTARIAARRRALRRVRAVAAASGHRPTNPCPGRNALGCRLRAKRRVAPDEGQADAGVWIDYGGDCLVEGEYPDYWCRQAKLRKEKQCKARREALLRRMRSAICFLLRVVRFTFGRRK